MSLEGPSVMSPDSDVREPGWRYCAGRPIAGRSWCAEHSARVYRRGAVKTAGAEQDHTARLVVRVAPRRCQLYQKLPSSLWGALFLGTNWREVFHGIARRSAYHSKRTPGGYEILMLCVYTSGKSLSWWQPTHMIYAASAEGVSKQERVPCRRGSGSVLARKR